MESPMTTIGELAAAPMPVLPKVDPQVALKLVIGLLPAEPGVKEMVA